ncbi:hypothetical protein U1Q18_003193 [Sarracenia purpurea var. burkii]
MNLMKKLASLSNGDTVLKYQLIPEDLDTLVSVKSDVDLRHMIEEHDRYESTGTPMLRAFLFPTNPIVVENHQTSSVEPIVATLEQRYIDAVNGIIRAATPGNKLPPVITRNSSPNCLSPAGSSPKSPESSNTNFASLEPPKGYQKSRILMQRVHSLPSISSIGSHKITATTHPVHHHNNQHHHQNHQLLQQHGYLSPLAQTPERLFSVRSVGREDSWKYQVTPSRSSFYPMATIARQNRGNGCYCSKCMHFDENGGYVNRKLDRGESIFRSPPLTSSPS